MPYPIENLAEVKLISRIAAGCRPRSRDIVVGIGDDAAVVRYKKGRCLILTTDMLVESVHFKKNEDAALVGYKAMAVNVSDVAAMGGWPKYGLVSLGLPERRHGPIFKKLFCGIRRCADKFHVDVVGGDTNRSPHLVVNVAMVGEVEEENLLLRSTARAGDHIFVSGPLGGSLRGRHLSFEPRLREARFLVKNFHVTSMIDLSDGLGVDLNRLVASSRVGAFIVEDMIPKSQGVTQTSSALFDGEDFELLFTLSGGDAARLSRMERLARAPFKFFAIGRVTDAFCGVRMLRRDGVTEKIGIRGFQHFRS